MDKSPSKFPPMNFIYNYFFRFSSIVVFCFSCLIVQAQTNPAPQSLPYTQTFGTLVATSSTFPAGWQAWNLSLTGSGSTFKTITPPASSDLSLIANSTAATNTGGIHNYNGKIGYLASATIDPAVCLAINSTGINNVLVAFDVLTIRNPSDVSNTRINQVDLQFRVGTSGTFSSVSNIASGIYQNNTVNQITAVTTPQNQISKSFTLPASCNNQAIVQLRWVQRDFSGTGNRSSFAVDNISICSSVVTPTITITGPSAFCSGGSAKYLSSITNGGAVPTYAWKKNGLTVGSNFPSLNISGLIAADQISCILTSNASCVSPTSVNSNVISIGTVISSPTITSASITNVSCQGARNGAINISVSGGTGPYTFAWDTINTLNGSTYTVTVGAKSIGNPLFGQGNPNTFIIDGIQAKELSLIRGINYSFNVFSLGHPFHISTDATGGNANFIVTNGQVGAPTQNGTISFAPSLSTPSLLFYPCQFHTFMGYRINILNGISSQNLSGIKAGKYTVLITDANGCTATGMYTVNELPSPLTLSATITNSSCGQSNGAIDLSVSGGVAPFTYTWDTINTSGNTFAVTVGAKSANHPYFNLGNPNTFLINGNEATTLNLVRGINYSFNVFSAGHPFHFSTDQIGGSTAGLISSGQTNAPNDNGTVFYTPDVTTPASLFYDCANHTYMGYNVNLFSGYHVEDLMGLHSGSYSVRVTDSNGCTATAAYSIALTPSQVTLSLNAQTNVSCYGGSNGAIDLQASNGQAPYVITGTGPTFLVSVAIKNHSHPYFSLGARPDGFVINGTQGAQLTLVRGITYTFSVLASGHAFFISTSEVGGSANLGSEVTDGVVGSMTGVGTLTFTPNSNHPPLLYYQCGIHDYMGYKLNIVDQLPNEDLSNCMAGNYSLSASDALGCFSPALNFNISTPPSVTYYFDNDLDGYGTSDEVAIGGCNIPNGFVELSGDCNEADATINPAAVEICDGIDNNCNNLIDGDDPTLNAIFYYLDSDQDGFGDSNDLGVASCTAILGKINNNTDCNDQNSNVHPGALEICNGIDDDCNGLIDDGNVCNVTFKLQLFIQGFYVGIRKMLEVVDPITSSLITDSITVQLVDVNAPFTMIYSATALVSIDGSAFVTFPIAAAQNNYYLVIKHRNALETWSRNPIIVSSQLNYDFTVSSNSAYGDNEVELEQGVFGIWSGDINQDGIINDSDFQLIQNGVIGFGLGYISIDITGDGVVESADYSLIENNVNQLPAVQHP